MQVVDSLRTAHGDSLVIAGPDVRYHEGPPPLEPVMSLEVSMPLLFTSFVCCELQRRRVCRITQRSPREAR